MSPLYFTNNSTFLGLLVNPISSNCLTFISKGVNGFSTGFGATAGVGAGAAAGAGTGAGVTTGVGAAGADGVG